jgi:hypothetical protein
VRAVVGIDTHRAELEDDELPLVDPETPLQQFSAFPRGLCPGAIMGRRTVASGFSQSRI